MTADAQTRTLPPLTTDGERIVDVDGREVLLRGANINGLGLYFQGVPDRAPVYPITDADWDRMAEFGFSAVRLLITWSRVEPERGQYDDAYFDEIDRQIDAAAARGIYTIVDMHQDVYSHAVFTADASECEPGTVPARGWDGAPEWAVFTDGEPTGLANPENRASTKAAERAWVNFYNNREGIRDAFVEAWRAVARRFAHRSEVAGYDLINEPENALPAGELAPIYDEILRDCVRVIREADRESGVPHLIFLEPALPCQVRERGYVHPTAVAFDGETTGIVYGPHNYAESLPPFRQAAEAYNAELAEVAHDLGLPVWIGEYGVFGTDEQSLDIARRYAKDEDDRRWGGTWWVWRQTYGDPHRLRWGGEGWEYTPKEKSVRLHTTWEETNLDEPTYELLEVLGRGFPWATPGRLDSLESDPISHRMAITATGGSEAGELIVWTPTTRASHSVETSGLTDVAQRPVPGGRLITATAPADGLYTLRVVPRLG